MPQANPLPDVDSLPKMADVKQPAVNSKFDDLAKKTKELEADVAKASAEYTTRDRAQRAKLIVDKAKEFVSEAHLSDAKSSLEDAFAPIPGLVLIEIEHKLR